MQQKFKQPNLFTYAFAACMLGIVMLNSSCRVPKGAVIIPVPKDTSSLASINHFISLETADNYRKSFTVEKDAILKQNPDLSLPNSEAFNKPAILELLKDNQCVGLRVSYGVKQVGNTKEFRLVLTGVDSQGNDLYVLAELPVQDNNGRGLKGTASNNTLAPPAPPVKSAVEQGQCNPPCR